MMQAAFRRFAAWTLLGLVLTGLAACGEEQANSRMGAGPRVPGQITIGMSQWPPNFHPAMEPSVVRNYIRAATYRPIIVWNADQMLECQVCVEVPTLENGLAKVVTRPDGTMGMEARYQIKPELTWGDGVPVTPADVAFGHLVGARGDTGYGNPGDFQIIERVEIIGPKDFIFHLRQPRFDFAYMPFYVLPAHIEKPIFDALQNKSEYGRKTAYNLAPSTPGLYFGPYVIDQVVAGAYVSLKPNPHWHGPKPAFEKVTMRVIESTAALEQNLLSGDIDYVAGEIGLQLDQALALERREPTRFDYLYAKGPLYERLDVNLDHPVLKDVRVRRALLMAVDRDRINTKIAGGKNRIAHGFLSETDRGFDPLIQKIPYDPKGAEALLEAAGWTKASDGIRRNKEGRRLSIDIVTTAGNRTRETVQQVIMSAWRDIGVEAIARNVPARTLLGQVLRRRGYDGVAMYAWSMGVDLSLAPIFDSVSIPKEANGWAGANYNGWSNPDKDRIIAELDRALEPAERTRLWADLQRVYVQDLPQLPLFFRTDPYILPRWLKGVRPSGHSEPSTNGIEFWRIEEVRG